ncbi:MAG: DUF3558 family protein [Dietzia psychralcaliphila]
MGTFRGVAAALAACVVLSGCASVQGGDQATTTSPVVTESPSNPWDLPIEQRPALFDPCAEIPIEAVEQGVGGPVEEVEQLHNNRPGELLSCGWKSNEVLVDVLSTWKSFDDYLSEPTGVIDSLNFEVAGRGVMRLVDREEAPTACRYIVFTSSGTVAISLSFVTTFDTFRGREFSKACGVLKEVSEPILKHVPNGDFR